MNYVHIIASPFYIANETNVSLFTEEDESVYFTLERGLILGFLFTLFRCFLYYLGFEKGFGSMENMLKIIIPAIVIAVLGIQIILFSFFFSILGLKEEK